MLLVETASWYALTIDDSHKVVQITALLIGLNIGQVVDFGITSIEMGQYVANDFGVRLRFRSTEWSAEKNDACQAVHNVSTSMVSVGSYDGELLRMKPRFADDPFDNDATKTVTDEYERSRRITLLDLVPALLDAC